MDKYKECNRQLTLTNQALRMQNSILKNELNYLHRQIVEEKIAHEKTKKMLDKMASNNINNTSREIERKGYINENNCEIKSPLRVPEDIMRNITLRRKKHQKHSNDMKISSIAKREVFSERRKSESNNSFSKEINFPPQINEEQQSFSEVDVSANVDNELIPDEHETNDINPDCDNYPNELDLLHLDTINEEQISYNSNETVNDITDFNNENLLSSTPNCKKVNKMMNKKLIVRLKRLNLKNLQNDINKKLNNVKNHYRSRPKRKAATSVNLNNNYIGRPKRKAATSVESYLEL